MTSNMALAIVMYPHNTEDHQNPRISRELHRFMSTITPRSAMYIMFLFKIAFISALSLSARAQVQGSPYSQCGGIGWSGSTNCIAGYTCIVVNSYYSQCLPGIPTPLPSPTTSPGRGGGTPSTTSDTAPTPKGTQIRTDQDPAYHLYLQDVGGAPILGPESSSGYFTIGKTITLNSANGSSLYLNIDTSVTTAWKPVTLDSTATTTTWGLSGDTIIYGNQQNFVVCPISGSTNYNIYLSTSNDLPTGCTNYITIHLPCLC